jgi:hypothetical protein
MSKTSSTVIAFLVAALGLYLLSLVFWSRFKHENFSAECSQGADIAKVDLVGTFAGFSNERGVPYFLRVQVFDGGKMQLEHPVLVEAKSRNTVSLAHIERRQLERASEGEAPTIWYAPKLDADYVEHQFEATLVSPAGDTRKLTCILTPDPKVEWRSPVWDALMSA